MSTFVERNVRFQRKGVWIWSLMSNSEKKKSDFWEKTSKFRKKCQNLEFNVKILTFEIKDSNPKFFLQWLLSCSVSLFSGTSESSASSSLLRLSSIVNSINNDEKINFGGDASENWNIWTRPWQENNR